MSSPSFQFYFAKLIDLGVVGVYFLVLGTLGSLTITKIVGDNSHAVRKSQLPLSLLIIKIICRTFLIMILASIITSIVQSIPFPLDGFGGFDHTRLKELNGGVLISFAIIAFQPQYKEDIISVLRVFHMV